MSKSANKEQAAYDGANEVTIKLQIKPLEKGGYLATSADVPGLVAEGRTIAETTEIAQGLARGSHEVWRHASGRKVTVPRHARDMPEGTHCWPLYAEELGRFWRSRER